MSVLSIAIGLGLVITGFLLRTSSAPVETSFLSQFAQGNKIWLMVAGQIAIAAGLFRLARKASESE